MTTQTQVGKLSEERLHELGHLSELRRIYEHMHDSFWQAVRAELAIPDELNVVTDNEGNLFAVEESP